MSTIRGLFEWSQRDHSLREVVEVFQRQLPVLAIVSEGYSGRDGMHEFASDEVYWIFDIQKQDKVVAKAALERYVSIPVDYPIPFQKIVNGRPVGSEMSISSIINDEDFRGQKIRFKDDVHVPFNFGAKDGSFDQFGEMEIIEKYSEKYLLCHSIVKQEIHPLVIGIPAYVPIRMEVASGFTHDMTERFERWMREVSEISKMLETGQVTPRQEILIFHESPGGDYEYVSPLKFTAHTYGIDGESDSDDDNIPAWQLPQSTASNRPVKKCYTVARNPIKVCIQPVALPPIPGPGPPREAFVKAMRTGIPGAPKFPSRFSKSGDRKELPMPRSSSTLPPKSSQMMSFPPLPPKLDKTKSSTTLPPKSSLNQSKDAKPSRPLRTMKSLDEGELGGGWSRTSEAQPSRFQEIHRNPPPPPPHSHTPQKPVSTENPKFNTKQRSASIPEASKAPLSETLSTGSRFSSWRTLDDVPSNLDISQLSVDGVARCLELLGLQEFVPFFRQMMVDGRMLLELDRAMLVDDFGLTKLDALRLTMFANKWRPNLKQD